MADDGVQRDLGRFEAQIAALAKEVSEQGAKLDSVIKTLSEARGGWRVLMLVGGASAAAGGMIVKFLPFLHLNQ